MFFKNRHRLDGPPVEWAICKWGYQLLLFSGCIADIGMALSSSLRHSTSRRPGDDVMLLAMPQRPRPARKVISRPVRQFDLGCVLNRLNSMTPSGRKAKKGAEQWQQDKKPASPSLFCCISWTRKERSTSCKYSRVCSGACTLPSWEDGIVSTSFHSSLLFEINNLIIF